MPEFDLDVLVIGGSGVDTIVRVPQLDMPVADSHLVPMVQTRVGHTGDNVAPGCHALLGTRLVDFLGQDAEGRLVREDAGLPCSWAIGGITKRAAKSRPRGRTSNVLLRHSSQFVIRALPPGLTVSTDLYNWDGMNPYHLEFAEATDIVFLSIAALPDYEHRMRQILRGRAQVVVATAGADGCYVMSDGGSIRYFAATPAFGGAVDSNGAGDAFVCGLRLAPRTSTCGVGSARFACWRLRVHRPRHRNTPAHSGAPARCFT